MSDTVIKVENVSKRYLIGSRRNAQDGLRHRLEEIANPLKWFKHRPKADRSANEEFWALKDVSFEVKQGDVMGFIGRNGAGKSTLLKVLSRITEPTKGRISMRGRVASLLEVGTGFHPELTGRENIFLNGAILGMSRHEIKRKFDEIVAFSEVETFLETPVKRYSSGMYVRLAFAVAAHLEPEVLIVDEVLAVGDAQFQKKCMGKMQDVSKDGRTILFVSHNLTAIKNLCNSGVYLKGGKVVNSGNIDMVIADYLASTGGSAEGTLLLERKDREGAGHVRMTRIWAEDGNKRLVEHAASGRETVIAIEYEASTSAELKNVRVSIAVKDTLDQSLFLCSSELISAEQKDCPPRGVIRCRIPELPLSGHKYNLMAYFEVDGVTEDFVDNAASLSVEDGDFYHSGKLYPPGWQGKGVLVKHSWEWPESSTRVPAPINEETLI